MNKFYTVANKVFTDNGAWIDNFVGDKVIALYIPGFAGKDHTYLAIKSAVELLEATGHSSTKGPWVPLGIGINTRDVFMGAVGSGNITDITPLGDNVNVTARLSSEAKTGEIVISNSPYNSPICKAPSSQKLLQQLQIQKKSVELKGKSEPQNIYIGSMSG